MYEKLLETVDDAAVVTFNSLAVSVVIVPLVRSMVVAALVVYAAVSELEMESALVVTAPRNVLESVPPEIARLVLPRMLDTVMFETLRML